MKKFTYPVSNHMLPFLWVHGEDENTYRKMVRVIHDASIGAFCVESRPHDGFLEETWWRDMDILIDEAKKLQMGIYILDDRHFPTGYANGALKNAPAELHRQGIIRKVIPLKKGEHYHGDILSLCQWTPELKGLGGMMIQYHLTNQDHFDDDSVLSASVCQKDSIVSLKEYMKGNVLDFTAQEDCEINLVFLTRNCGTHRDYINMLDEKSVRLLIDETYEKHYARYKDEFGKTILGFFSDEPEIGNYLYTSLETEMGANENVDYPMSAPLLERLKKELPGYPDSLALLWKNDGDADFTAKIRYLYMSMVTEQVSLCFSRQIGEWCRERNVDYIGHMIEDNNQHGRTGSSLGHYFKGLKYQSWAGVDDIGGQVLPFMEEATDLTNPFALRDGAFYHYTLGKLAASSASLNPVQNGNSMCEIFGNYGWSEGVQLEKYLLDHFLVRGVNHFVPHAFTCKSYPDPDCPPHFYADGHNPEYRHFGKLMAYGNRVCSLISGGRIDAPVGILYHAESEWTGRAMLNEEIAKELACHQMDYSFVPEDIFVNKDFYHTEIGEKLSAGNQIFSAFVIGECDRIPSSVAEAVITMIYHKIPIYFINKLPFGTCEGNPLPEEILSLTPVSLNQLSGILSPVCKVKPDIPNKDIRILHYIGKYDFWMVVNEGKNDFDGNLIFTDVQDFTLYDAMEDCCYKADVTKEDHSTKVHLHLPFAHSVILVSGLYECASESDFDTEEIILNDFEVSHSSSMDYPHFEKGMPDGFFSGFIAYEKKISSGKGKRRLVIENASDSAEVFFNGQSMGIQIVPPFDYMLPEEEGILRIEIATTLENERKKDPSQAEMIFGIGEKKDIQPSPVGITGKVIIREERR